ncbi:MAG TPA: GNAT family N-acetyltransferase [Sphingobacteriaceae bacterium]
MEKDIKSDMLELIRTTSDHADFRALVVLLDQDLAIRDGEEHAFYAQYNKIDKIGHVIVAYDNGRAVACGAIKHYADQTAEVKRMFVLPEFRGNGIAGFVLRDLEKWAAELDYSECILETGKKQPEAIRLYQKCGYELIPNYGQYAGVENSVCMKRAVR